MTESAPIGGTGLNRMPTELAVWEREMVLRLYWAMKWRQCQGRLLLMKAPLVQSDLCINASASRFGNHGRQSIQKPNGGVFKYRTDR